MMITQLLKDLVATWRTMEPKERMSFCPVMHDACVEAGYPSAAAFHFQRVNASGWNPCVDDCSLILAIHDNDVTWIEQIERDAQSDLKARTEWMPANPNK